MSQLSFQAKINLISTFQPDANINQWQCELGFSDNEFVFSGLSIAIDDVVVFDTGTYETGTFTFYTVTSVITPDAVNPVVLLEYMNTNDNVTGSPDLSYVVGSDGTITRPTANLGLLPVVSRDIQLISDRFTEYVQNYNFAKIVDNIKAGDRTFLKINGDILPMLKGMAVYMDETDTSVCKNAVATNDLTAHVIGLVSDSVVAPNDWSSIISKGMIEKTTNDWNIITGAAGGLIPGKDYFLRHDMAGGLTHQPPTGSNKYVVRVGKAITTTLMDVDIESPIQL